jgi:CRP/FNR family transcriptional regulator, cyclic AMP receptor protein
MAEKVLERKTFPEGGIIFKEGEQGNVGYVVQSGAVEIVKVQGGEEVILGGIEKGGIFGEMALIDDQPRMATARASEPTTLIVVSQSVFQQKMAAADPFIRGLINIFLSNIRRLANKG